MITDNDLVHNFDPDNLGLALCWVIGEDVLYDMPLDYEIAKMFLDTNNAEDISYLYPDHDGIVVRLMNNDTVIEELKTSEYFGSILLSNPIVVNLDNHKNGSFVISPNAKFINYEFVVDTSHQMDIIDPWYPHGEPKDGGIANCYKDCKCGLL